jgi:DNA-binding NtrC family response regulator
LSHVTHDPAKADYHSMPPEREAFVTLLAIDDDPDCLDLVRDALERDELQIFTAADARTGLELVRRYRPELVLLDLVLPGVQGFSLLQSVLECSPCSDVILITGHYSTDSAVEAIQKGASDYLTKPLCVAVLRERVGKFIAEAAKRQLDLRLDGEILRASEFEGMIGQSPLVLDVFTRIRRVAPHFRTALLTGATGTGKELAARALHRLSPAAKGPFVVCNTSAVVETLFESELFGHVKGAFTGAVQDKLGLFEHADGGTLFLDEIGDMPFATQSKLLRVLQDQEVQRVGSVRTRKVDVRVIAATNQDLRAMIQDKRFREDLFYRLSMVKIHLPRLMDRKEDLLLLQRHLVQQFASEYGKPIRGLTPRAHAMLVRYHWPGNIRELENVIGNACMMAQGDRIDVRDLPEELKTEVAQAATEDEEDLPLAEMERRYAVRVLAHVAGNKVRAAKILGINRATLYRLLQRQADSADAPSENV